jgi:hypothetical protein
MAKKRAHAEVEIAGVPVVERFDDGAGGARYAFDWPKVGLTINLTPDQLEEAIDRALVAQGMTSQGFVDEDGAHLIAT